MKGNNVDNVSLVTNIGSKAPLDEVNVAEETGARIELHWAHEGSGSRGHLIRLPAILIFFNFNWIIRHLLLNAFIQVFTLSLLDFVAWLDWGKPAITLGARFIAIAILSASLQKTRTIDIDPQLKDDPPEGMLLIIAEGVGPLVPQHKRDEPIFYHVFGPMERKLFHDLTPLLPIDRHILDQLHIVFLSPLVMHDLRVEVVQPSLPALFPQAEDLALGFDKHLDGDIIPLELLLGVLDQLGKHLIFVGGPFPLIVFLSGNKIGSTKLEEMEVFVGEGSGDGVPLEGSLE